MVVENLSVPTDRRVWGEARVLRERGLDVSIICPAGVERDVALYEIIDGIRIFRYAPVWASPNARGYITEYAAALWRIGSLLRGSVPTPIDVLHLANPPDLLFLLALLPRLIWGTRIVFDQHDLAPEVYESRFGRRGGPWWALRGLEWLSYRSAHHVIVPNQSYRTIALERGQRRSDQVSVVRNAPDPAVLFAVEPDPRLKRGKPNLAVYVGVIGPQDGVDQAIRAIHHYRHRLGRDDLHVAVVGDGDSLPSCRALVRSLGLDSIVEFTGWQDMERIRLYLSTADVALAPEPPNPLNICSTMVKVLEYQALGVPIVAYDLPETRYSAGGAATYARAGDEADFAMKIAQALDNAPLRGAMSVEGRTRSQGTLSWSRSAQHLLEAYESFLAIPLAAHRSSVGHDVAWSQASSPPHR